MPHRLRACGLATLLFALLVMAAVARPQAQAPNRPHLAFLRGGEVWMSDLDGQRATQLTRTRGKVEDFNVALAEDYLAYTRTVKYVLDDAGLEPGEKPGKRSVQSIVIMSLATGQTIAEIQPGDEWIYIDKWLPRGRLLGHSSSGFDVTDVFEFDVVTKQRRNLGLEMGSRLVEGDMAPEGLLSAYVDDTGVGRTYQQRLHLVDRGTDTIRASKRSILVPRIAHGRGTVAFVEVTDGPGPVRDRVWVLTLPAGDLRAVHEDSVRPKSWGVSGLSWSTDDRYLAIDYGGVATIIDTRPGSASVQVRATDLCWISAGGLVIAGQTGLDLFDAASGARRSIVPKASTPRCLSGTATHVPQN